MRSLSHPGRRLGCAIASNLKRPLSSGRSHGDYRPLVFWMLLLLSLPAGCLRAEAAPRQPDLANVGICRIIEQMAAANQLPVEYLSRLLWIESGFSSSATSPAGAEGIAQFMPETAAEQGLTDTRDPLMSISHAARLLDDLHRQFGNLGLAAAAYNAGPARLTRWLQGTSLMPAETRL